MKHTAKSSTFVCFEVEQDGRAIPVTTAAHHSLPLDPPVGTLETSVEVLDPPGVVPALVWEGVLGGLMDGVVPALVEILDLGETLMDIQVTGLARLLDTGPGPDRKVTVLDRMAMGLDQIIMVLV